jgi:hypothetical protein
MLSQFSANPLKVIVSAAGVAAFNSRWPCSELRDSRHYWFEFDESRDLIDSDVPEHDDGSAAAAMAEDCKAWLFDDVNPEWAPDNDSPVFILTEEERKAAFRACPILESYIATALEDLQLSEADEACTESREARDSGTVYTLPAPEFEKAKAICERFAAEHAADIEAAGELVPGEPGLQYTTHRYMTADRIGSTLYLARVGSGVTFTDDGDAPALQRMAEAARAEHAESPYFGDDGGVYGF